jgi:uncharacterized protein YceK
MVPTMRYFLTVASLVFVLAGCATFVNLIADKEAGKGSVTTYAVSMDDARCISRTVLRREGAGQQFWRHTRFDQAVDMVKQGQALPNLAPPNPNQPRYVRPPAGAGRCRESAAELVLTVC